MINSQLFLDHVREKFCHWEKVPFVYIAVSGGMDSMVLLESVWRLWRNRKLDVNAMGVLHVNHNLRGKESREDGVFVAKEAGRRGLSFCGELLEWKQGERASQRNLREKRYGAFQKHIKEGVFIALAHHLDDQAETIFQRILRGTGVRGLCGMEEKSGAYVRPFLQLPRSQIHSVACEWNIAWREDPSNKDSKYERNWLRQEVFPLLEARRPGFAKRLVDLSQDVGALRRGRKEIGIKGVELKEGTLYVKSALERVPSEFFIQHFNCDRKSIIFIKELLKKEKGKLSLQGGMLWVSRGYCLWLKDLSSWQEWACGKQEGQVWRSILGTWKKEKTKVELINRSAYTSSLKKKFLKIPAFFREAVPVQKGEGAVFLARDLTYPTQWPLGDGKLYYQPSDLSKQLFRSRVEKKGRISQ